MSPNKIISDSDCSIKRRPIEGCHSAPPKQASIDASDFEAFSLGLQDNQMCQSEPGVVFESNFDSELEFPDIEDERESPYDEQPVDIGFADFNETSGWFQ